MENKSAEESWQKFLKWISDKSNGFVFRGVSNKEHLLVPSVGRLMNYSFENEINLFEHFKMKANMLTSAKNDFEWLSIAQHHGLPTRLLDWTENPLIACFFAVKSNKEDLEKDGRIYMTNIIKNTIYWNNENPFDESYIGFHYPKVSTTRIALQKGIFSVHPRPNLPVVIAPPHRQFSFFYLIEVNRIFDYIEDMDMFEQTNFGLERLKDGYTKSECLEYVESYYNKLSKIELVFNIKSNHKEHFLQQLNKLGIDETIFGDLDSIADKLKNDCEKYRLITTKEVLDIESIKLKLNQKIMDLRPTAIINLLKNRDYCTLKSNISLDLNKVADKKLTFMGYLQLHPNYFDIKECWNNTLEETENIKAFYNVLHAINIHYAYPYETIKFEINVNDINDIDRTYNLKIIRDDEIKHNEIKKIYFLFKKYNDILAQETTNQNIEILLKKEDWSDIDKKTLKKIFKPLTTIYNN